MTANKYKITALALVLVLALGGCSWFAAPEATPPPEITGNTNLGAPREEAYAADDVFSLNYDSGAGFNPVTTSSGHNLLIAPLMFEPLFEVDENMTPQPVLCSRWETQDGIHWSFYIDTGRKMHDGSTVTAQDARYTILRAMQSSKYRDRLSIVAGISALGDELLAFTLRYENRMFPALLNIPIMKNGTGEQLVPVGTGPYMMADSGDALVPFPEHPSYASLPIDVIYLKEYTRAEELILAYEDALIDLVTNDPTGMSNLGYGSANEIRDFPTTNLHYLGFNMEKATGYRTAFTYTINRSYITTDIMGGRGVAVTLPISPVSPYYNAAYAQLFDFSAEKFEAALKSAGFEDYDNDGLREFMVTGIPIEIDISFIVNNESAVKVAAARDIAGRLRAAGIAVTLRELSFTDYKKALEDMDFDMYYGEAKLTPDFNLLPLLDSDGALNYGKARESSYSNLIHEFLSAQDEGRKLACDLMLRYITQTAPIIPIAFEKQEALTHAGVVTGIRPTQYNVFNKFTDWNINLASNPVRNAAKPENKNTGE